MSIAVCVTLLVGFLPRAWTSGNGKWTTVPMSALRSDEEVVLSATSPVASDGDNECHYYNCLDVYRCGRLSNHKLTVYVYPLVRFINDKGTVVSDAVSEQFRELLEAVVESPYYTPDPEKACILIPAIDTLNQNNLRLVEIGQALASLPYWGNGENHLLFNMLPGTVPNYSTVLEVPRGKAIVAGGGFSTWSYRRGFDISIPIYNPLVDPSMLSANSPSSAKKWYAVSSQTNIHFEYRQELLSVAEEHPELLVLDRCASHQSGNYTLRCFGEEYHSYPQILQESTFCLVVRGARLGQTVLFDAMMAGCIPVVIADSFVLPFSEVIDWKRAIVRIYEDEIPEMMDILKSFSDERVVEMKNQVLFLWKKYFSSMRQITLTTLHIMNDRIFTHAARSYHEWNNPPTSPAPQSPLFLPMIAPKSQGFTAVILTYNRLDSLFQVIQNVVKAPSLAKVLVVWNNQNTSPPQAAMWPKINKPLKVVQTSENKLSNRFYPYDEIETEAILAIDDDIVMLTADELEFGFEVWREFPDRIVGYPSRVHTWDNDTGKWKYESEWTNEISMVLTGVAFYHKLWSYMYTTAMPGNMKAWVDDHMNCEDIAMNFLVTNMTGKAPIKVAPRKKFKCPECTNMEMLSTDLSHMMERSECVNKFTEIYGYMPLKPVEFRADPVLYKDNFPDKLKRFNNIGSL